MVDIDIDFDIGIKSAKLLIRVGQKV